MTQNPERAYRGATSTYFTDPVSGTLVRSSFAILSSKAMRSLDNWASSGDCFESPEMMARPCRNMSSARGAWPCLVFRHPDETYLVQCRASYDVTRTPAAHSHCYKLQ